MRPPTRAIEPCSRGVEILTRGDFSSAAARLSGPEGPAAGAAAEGAFGTAAGTPAEGAGETGALWLACGGGGGATRRAGSKKKLKPIRIAIERAMAMMRLRWSMSMAVLSGRRGRAQPR